MTTLFRDLWSLRPGVVYLNHGSFGPSPRAVIANRQEWIERLECEPMDFFVRQMGIWNRLASDWETLLARAERT